ncbi:MULTISPECIES: hypothetical protein [Saccharopolyspora]|uniref:hypothetical protein n=1 Tax=Saccharopolyspora TaxID=1835 RepID=UPI001CD409B5|nr:MULTISPECIES: hypothetical protein [unclassified Saccharopolyspora]MCA1185121.1 hypothetical protein [Saccharopolyspora sp. 6T]MCA1191403.1 hypothetical protein [Saccharopolyspora sp. 6V]MCA1224996.1 hypothetical protein [Saccharopolyspora sp. 6M]MCA1278513.1 hypothetical protein [Saccharopolyspora sp. 7B]
MRQRWTHLDDTAAEGGKVPALGKEYWPREEVPAPGEVWHRTVRVESDGPVAPCAGASGCRWWQRSGAPWPRSTGAA